MERKEHVARVGSVIRHKVVLSDDPSVAGTHDSTVSKHGLLRTIAESLDMASCGLTPFQTLRVYHDGQRWVAEMEAEVEG